MMDKNLILAGEVRLVFFYRMCHGLIRYTVEICIWRRPFVWVGRKNVVSCPCQFIWCGVWYEIWPLIPYFKTWRQPGWIKSIKHINRSEPAPELESYRSDKDPTVTQKMATNGRARHSLKSLLLFTPSDVKVWSMEIQNVKVFIRCRWWWWWCVHIEINISFIVRGYKYNKRLNWGHFRYVNYKEFDFVGHKWQTMYKMKVKVEVEKVSQ